MRYFQIKEENLKTDETVIKCSARLGGTKTEWETYIKHIDFYHSYYKAVIEDDESIFTVIVGNTDEYNWIAIPTMEVSCPLSSFTNVDWNCDHLAGLIGVKDATTIAEAIAYIDRNKKILKKR
jgi:hypothetical protein